MAYNALHGCRPGAVREGPVPRSSREDREEVGAIFDKLLGELHGIWGDHLSPKDAERIRRAADETKDAFVYALSAEPVSEATDERAFTQAHRDVLAFLAARQDRVHPSGVDYLLNRVREFKEHAMQAKQGRGPFWTRERTEKTTGVCSVVLIPLCFTTCLMFAVFIMPPQKESPEEVQARYGYTFLGMAGTLLVLIVLGALTFCYAWRKHHRT